MRTHFWVAAFALLLVQFTSTGAYGQTPAEATPPAKDGQRVTNGWSDCPPDCPPYITPAHMRAHQAQVRAQLAAMEAERAANTAAVDNNTAATDRNTAAVEADTAARRAPPPPEPESLPAFAGWHRGVLLSGGGVFLNDGPGAYLLTVEGLLRHVWRSGLGGEGGLSAGIWQTEDATPSAFGLHGAAVASWENVALFLGGSAYLLQSFEEGGSLLLGTADGGFELHADGILLRAGPALTVASSGPDGDPGEPNEAVRLAGMWWKLGIGGYF